MSVTGQHTELAPLIEQGRASFAARARWNVLEVAFWLAALATIFLLPSKHLILTEIALLARSPLLDAVGDLWSTLHERPCALPSPP